MDKGRWTIQTRRLKTCKKVHNNKERSTQYASNNYTKALPPTNFSNQKRGTAFLKRKRPANRSVRHKVYVQ